MNLFGFLLKKHRGLVIFAGLVGLVSGGLNAMLISLVNDNLGMLDSNTTTSALFFFMIAFACLVSGFLAESLTILLSARVTLKLRLSIAKSIINSPLRQLEQVGPARLYATFTDDLPNITGAMLYIPNLMVNLALTLGSLVYLGLLSFFVFSTLMGTIVLGLVIYILGERLAYRHVKNVRDSWGEMLEHFNALNTGIKELKLHYRRAVSFYDDALKRSGHDVYRSTLFHRNIYSLLANWVSLLYFFFMGMLLFKITDLHSLEPKVIVGFALVVLFIRMPLSLLITVIPQFRQADVALKMIKELDMSLSDSTPFRIPALEERLARESRPTFESIQLREICHTYYNERDECNFTLGPINLDIAPGELIFLIGGNGSGKTTLAKLITGLYTPNSGRIILNGETITEESQAWYLQQFSAIFSEFYVFDEIMGIDSVDLDETATRYAEKLHLNHKVTIKNGKLSTTSLSSGQRKRLALLVSYLEDRNLYLFDEWAADQDPEFKLVFYRELLPELKKRGKTVIVVSHDDRYFDVADRVFKLNEGKIAELALSDLL